MRNTVHKVFFAWDFEKEENLSVSMVDRPLSTIEPEEKKLLYDKAVGKAYYDRFVAETVDEGDAVNRFLDTARRTGFGSEVVIGYLAAEENAITTVRMILTGLLSGIDPDRLKERLRDTYV